MEYYDRESNIATIMTDCQATRRVSLTILKPSKSAMQIRGVDRLSLQEIGLLLDQGARFVFFEYCISFLVVTWRKPTDIFLLRSGQRGVLLGWPYLLCTLFLGWWGIPWGFILTPKVLMTNLSGGRDVTDEVWAFLQETAEAQDFSMAKESG